MTAQFGQSREFFSRGPDIFIEGADILADVTAVDPIAALSTEPVFGYT